MKNYKFDHFKNLNELIKTVEMWHKTEEPYYERWFGLEDLYKLVQIIKELQKTIDTQK